MLLFGDEKFGGLLEAMPGVVQSALDAVIAVDSTQTIILFNAAAEKMFGCQSSQAIGMSLCRFIPPRAPEEQEANAEGRGEQDNDRDEGGKGEPLQGSRILRATRFDGSKFPIEASISRLDTSSGPVFTAFIRDITERQVAEQALARSEAGLRQAQLLARLGHIVTGRDGVFESWSEGLPALIGLTDETMPRTTRAWIKLIHPEDREQFRSYAIEAGRTHRRSEFSYRIRRGEDWSHVRQVLSPLGATGDDAQQTRWFNTLQDVSDQKQAELRIRSQNRVLLVLSSINALIVRATDIGELLQESCRIAVEAGEFSIVWIGLIDEKSKSFRFAAGYGGPPAYYDSLRGKLAGMSLEGESAMGSATRDLQPVTRNDLAKDPVWHKHALAAGSRSLATLPLAVGGRAVGVFVLHATTPDFFDSNEVRLLRDLAGDISFAIDHLQKAGQIAFLANYDALTGLPNRGLFSVRLQEVLRDQDADREMLAVAFLDVERLRRVNETLGRAAGDELLKLTGMRLQTASTSAARIGVDVFAVMIRDKRSAADIARAVEELALACFGEPFNLSGVELRVGTRCGVAVYPTDGFDPETLLNNAEAALRKAKSSSERFVFYGPELNARAAEALNLESRLRRAIERQEFILHYQPKLKFDGRRLCGVEALIRWEDPQRGLVAPAEFIPVLEESGLIGTVGEWALRRALADQREWRAAGLAAPRVAVNVSPTQLRRADFATMVSSLVAANGGGELELEITESMIMENVEGNIELLKRIRSSGVTIAIDDFGTGYSSLSYVAKLPVTSLKIDRTFVVGMTEGPHGLAIVSSIIALAHSLKLTVVAEGVETEEQARLLHLLDCDEAQGFLFSRPVSAAEIAALLRQ